jgi:hypothetical protein
VSRLCGRRSKSVASLTAVKHSTKAGLSKDSGNINDKVEKDRAWPLVAYLAAVVALCVVMVDGAELDKVTLCSQCDANVVLAGVTNGGGRGGRTRP